MNSVVFVSSEKLISIYLSLRGAVMYMRLSMGRHKTNMIAATDHNNAKDDEKYSTSLDLDCYS